MNEIRDHDQATAESGSAVENRPLRSQVDRWLALGGVVGPILFVLTFTIAGVLRPGYSPISKAISDLGIGDNAWALNGSLVILGSLMIGLDVAFYGALRTTARSTLRITSAAFLLAPGLGFIVAGVFPETNPIHWMLGAPLVYLGSMIGFLLAGLLLRGDQAWAGWARYSLIASGSTLVLIGVTFYVFAAAYADPASTSLGGLMERVVFIEILAWYVLCGWRLWRGFAGAPRPHGR